LASEEFFDEVFDIFVANLSPLQILIGKVFTEKEEVFSDDEIIEALRGRFGLDLTKRDLREEMKILQACSVLCDKKGDIARSCNESTVNSLAGRMILALHCYTWRDVMEFRVHCNLRAQIKEERRDIALISAPGMGLTTLLRNLEEVDRLPITWLDVNTITQLWDKEYCERTKNRRYVIHAAVIRALSAAQRVSAVSDEALFRSSLPGFLSDASSGFDFRSETLIVIDDFDALPSDLALIICKELKSIADRQHQALKTLRFIVGGAVDFNDLFAGELPSGGSPATNFLKYRPYQFLLTPSEAVALLETSFPQITQLHPSVTKFVIDWCGGYLHYLLEFAKWILEQAYEISDVTPHSLMDALQNCIADRDRMSLFKYCDAAWNLIAEETTFLNLLTAGTSAGYVREQGV